MPEIGERSSRRVNVLTFIPNLTFTDYEWFPWSICNGCGMPAGNAYPSGHLVPSPIVGLACAPIVETRFLELAMSLLDFSHRILIGTFSIMLDSPTREEGKVIDIKQTNKYGYSSSGLREKTIMD